MSTGYNEDYTRQPLQNAGQSAPAGQSVDDFNPDDYSFLPISAAPDVDAIERDAESREFREIEPGDHELVVVGFLKRPEVKLKNGWLHGRQVSWQTATVGVRLARATDRQATILDFFDLPPTNPDEQDAYLNASTKTNGSNPGFAAGKFGHFISRLGFPFAPGAPLPAEACTLSNWIGRHIHATVGMQANKDGNIDQRTGLPFPPRAQIKLFSYRPAEQAGRGASPAGPVRQVAQAGRQAPQATRPPQASPLAAAGLDNL